ncbi:dipeptide/oligopeptide/nickel ABC transporter permease/ATP-binding protein [Streptomyces fuscichromogenes]|uniref:Peptide ABC transporter ATP-binding protein n=1 Tax=Streptomyces fuscichromogenes TaxID=1324013 RepID=A0A918CTH5_9ACTN|nr:dipeptide/oligopeptide/nickel ABC transporter permease/ATP-binding protein [Streptomyces fuscichromogenes]GGN22712.1 peptide ABC transporter ATP-binding protein [Streptomyces fuscichromogenes]
MTARTSSSAPDPSTPSPARRLLAGLAKTIRTPMGATATVFLGVVLLAAIVAPMLWSGTAAKVDATALDQGPSGEHWLGTDNLGRDLLLRVLVAARLSVLLSLSATAIGISLGLLLGAAPWLLGPRLGRLAAAFVNIAVAFPMLLMTLFFAVIFGVGVQGSVCAIGISMAPWFARLTQTLIAGVQKRDFVAAARIARVSRFGVLRRHILPNIAEPLIVNVALAAAAALLAFAGLSFLGLGVQAPEYDWGLLLNEGLSGIYVNPAGALGPGIAIVVAGLGFNLFGEALAKVLGSRHKVRTFRPRGASRTVSGSGGHPRQHATDGSAGDAIAPAGEVPVLEVDRLRVSLDTPNGTVSPVREISFSMKRGEALGVVGESGSGKSLTALAVAQLLESPLHVEAATLRLLGKDLMAADPRSRATRRFLATSLGLVFQNPTTSFNPTMRIGPQLAEVARLHQDMSRRQAGARAVDRLRAVRIPGAERRAKQYPHEFSGGMRQRAMVGMAMMGNPSLIIADEPTTALDVTIQRQVLNLLEQIRVENQVAVLLISHDISVIGQFCSRVLVMYAGRVVEELPSADLRTSARHPYTRALLSAVPDMTADRSQPLATVPGRPVDPADRPAGCAFAPRCTFATAQCHTAEPPLQEVGSGGTVACWNPQEGAVTAVQGQVQQAGRGQA